MYEHGSPIWSDQDGTESGFLPSSSSAFLSFCFSSLPSMLSPNVRTEAVVF